MHTLLIGLNHKTAPLSIREKLHFSEQAIPKALSELNKNEYIKGSVIVDTCNRVEIYASTSNVDIGKEVIKAFLLRYHSLNSEELLPYLYEYNCNQAVKHLYYVTSGIDSMLIGEEQILGQVKSAFEIAMQNKYTNGHLNKLFQTAIQTGKKVRSETNISTGIASYGSASLEVINQLYSLSEKLEILILGAGEMAEISLKNILKRKKCKISICNRTQENAEALALKYEANIIPWNDRYSASIQADIILVSTSSEEFVLTAKEFDKYTNTIQHPIVIIDLAVPRNVDPQISHQYIKVLSIDDFTTIINNTLEKRNSEIEPAKKIIEEIYDEYKDWYALQTIIPVMQSLKVQFDKQLDDFLVSKATDLSDFSDPQKIKLKQLILHYNEESIRKIMLQLRDMTSIDELRQIATRLREQLIKE